MNIKDLRQKQVLELCKSLLEDYQQCLTDLEKEQIRALLNTDESLINSEDILLPIVEKVWNLELKSGNYVVISWNKYAASKPEGIVTFATLCQKDNIVPFCDMTTGIQYEIGYHSLVGALFKDGATLIEDLEKQNDYTIGIIGDKVINSYNGATKLITPKQLLNQNNNQYRSKHNELILNTEYIKPIGIYELNGYHSKK